MSREKVKHGKARSLILLCLKLTFHLEIALAL
jgi:hypothetical protein